MYLFTNYLTEFKRRIKKLFMKANISKEELKKLFTKPYVAKSPSREEWSHFYDETVKFIDPTQEKYGLEEYIETQEKLLKRCDDVFLKTNAIVIDGNIGFIEWTMGLKIINQEFIYPGTTRLIFGDSGKLKEHRDYFDFFGPTFGPIPVLGSLIKWIYGQFVN